MIENDKPFVANQDNPGYQTPSIHTLQEMLLRSKYAALLGLTHGGNRDLYTALGYTKDLQFSDYWNAFKRSSLGRRVVCAPVESTWRKGVDIMEDDKPETTKFEQAWLDLDKKCKLVTKLARLDKLVGLGDYAVLLLGFGDGLNLDQPLTGTNNQLLYVQPYHQGCITILEWEEDTRNERYGKPKVYKLTATRPYGGATSELRVHHSRVIHVAEGQLENDITGTPRLESVFNRLQDIQKLAGGSAEMFWLGALGGKAFSAKEGTTLKGQALIDIQSEIDEYVHGLRRYMRLQNMDVTDLTPQVSDPNPHIDAQIKLISGDTGIPQRILTGSERGELASSQDENNWLSRVQERQEQYAEPEIVRPFVDKLIEVGALPKPGTGEYQVKFPDLWSASEQEMATVAKIKTEALAAYSNAPGIDAVMPVDFFFEEILGLTGEQIDRIKQMLAENPPEEDLEPVDEIDPLTGLPIGQQPPPPNSPPNNQPPEPEDV